MNSEAWERLLAAIGATVTATHPDKPATDTEVGKMALRQGAIQGHQDDEVLVRLEDLVELMRMAAGARWNAEQMEHAERNRDELAGLIGAAQQTMSGEGRTDAKLRQAGRELGLLDAHRPLKDWHQIAYDYWRLRYGIPPDEQGGPVEPLPLEEAQTVMMERYCQAGETFDSLVKGCQRAGLELSLKHNHPSWKHQKMDK